MNEFWLITAPGEPTCEDTWAKLERVTSKEHELSTNFKLPMPDFKVGTFDNAIGLCDDLAKLDVYAESVTKTLVQYTSVILNGTHEQLFENLQGNGKDIAAHLTHFQWETGKYPVRESLRTLVDLLNKKVAQIETDFKTKAKAYNILQKQLTSFECKTTGSLLTKDLSTVVKKEHFVLDSEHLVTLLVVVPRAKYKDWQQHYESLTDMVLPRSSNLVCEDADNGLFTVTLFRNVADEFKLHCHENSHGFVVRNFVYDEKTLDAAKKEHDKLVADAKKQFGPLIRWLQVNFAKLFSVWMHAKMLRAFVESVLRYGLPINFQAMLLQPREHARTHLRKVLDHLYAHLDTAGSAYSRHIDLADEAPTLSSVEKEDYTPYVFFRINLASLLEDTTVL